MAASVYLCLALIAVLAVASVVCVPTMTVSTSYIQHAENVTVMWMGVHNASSNDILALFVPPPLAVRKASPLNTFIILKTSFRVIQ